MAFGNGPWGPGTDPYNQYSYWSPKTGVLIAGGPGLPQGPRVTGVKDGIIQYDRPVQQAAPAAPANNGLNIDWSKMFGGGQAQKASPMRVQSSITAGPVYSQPQVSAALGSYSRFNPGGGGTAENLYNQEAQRGMLNTGRAMSEGNAAQLLASQKARSESGLRWGGLGQQQQNLNDNFDMGQQKFAMSLLQAMGGLS